MMEADARVPACCVICGGAPERRFNGVFDYEQARSLFAMRGREFVALACADCLNRPLHGQHQSEWARGFADGWEVVNEGCLSLQAIEYQTGWQRGREMRRVCEEAMERGLEEDPEEPHNTPKSQLSS